MKKVILLFALISFSLSATYAAENKVFDFEVYVLDQPDDDVEVYGRFTANEGKFGGIELIFYKSKYSYSIRSIEDIEDYAMTPNNESRKTESDNIRAIIQMFVKPALDFEGKIRLKGKLKHMYNMQKSGEPLYKIIEEPLDFTLPENGRRNFVIEPEVGSDEIRFAIIGNYRKKIMSDFSRPTGAKFNIFYSLFNSETNRYDIENDVCNINYLPSEKGNNLVCTHSRMFQLEDNDSLLYIVEYNLENVTKDKNGLLELSINVERNYIVNPIRYYEDPEDSSPDDRHYGTGTRTIETTKSIDGKSHKIKARIEDGRITEFTWDNIRLTAGDIIQNWRDIVTILRQIETTGNYKYKRPRINSTEDSSKSSQIYGLLNTPSNFTGDKVKRTAYSKTIRFLPNEKIEINIPFSKKDPIPFEAYEIIKLTLQENYK